ncbi:MAG: hypothetical protein M1839_007760 [Geoglossum umbratile]|nr:MAG: hypothetical protein M1839_007760 [Geoglossum umbratile]
MVRRHLVGNAIWIGSLSVQLILATPTEYWTSALQLLPRQDTKFHWTAIGDSWTTGVSWSKGTQWNGQADCFRYNQAWPAQMATDSSWTSDAQEFIFAACAGARLPDTKEKQLPVAGTPSLMIGTMGGNQAEFGNIVEACIYRPLNPRPDGPYGQPYWNDPEGKGQCKKLLKTAKAYISSGQLETDLRHTLDDIFASNAAKSHARFDFYLVSYAQFFNPDSNDCDGWYFQPTFVVDPVTNLPEEDSLALVVKPLRKEMNDAIDQYNQIYQKVVNSYKPPSGMHLGFIPISDAFAGHRFCEPGHTRGDQFSSDNVWMFNLNVFGNAEGDADGKEIYPLEVGKTKSGFVYTAWPKGVDEKQFVNTDPFFHSGKLSPGSSGYLGRPFHPKQPGHKAMKDIIIAKLRSDGVPGVKTASQGSAPATTSTAPSSQRTAPDGPRVAREKQVVS